MNNKTIEKSIERAVNEAPSFDFTKIANTPFVKMTEHDYITRQSETHVPNYHWQFTSALACCVVMLLCFTGWFVQYRLPDSIITFDVNPSIAIVTNRHNQILSIKALNNDAQKVLDDININSSDLDSMAASIITSIINQDYLSTNKNVVMISVENKHLKEADTLALSLKQVIRNHALSQNINPQILKQTFQKNKDEAALAEQYNISEGKLRLIKKIVSSKHNYSIDSLASKSMEDLLDISKKNKIDLHEIIQFDDSTTKDINDNSSTSDEEQNTKKANNINNDGNTDNTNNASQSENSPIKNSTKPSLNYNNENQSSQSGIVKNENRSSKSSYIKNDDSSSQADNEQDGKSSYHSDEDTNQSNISKTYNESDSESKTNDSDLISDDEFNDESDKESNDDDSSFDSENSDTDSTSSNDDNEKHTEVETNDDNSDSESSFDSGEDDMDSYKQSSDEHDEPDYD